MSLRISYRTGIGLAALGWLLLFYPYSLLLYRQLVSGEIVLVVYQAFSHGSVTNATLMVALSVAPVAALLFLGVLYLEGAGRAGPLVRRIAAAIAAALMLAATAADAIVLSYYGWLRNPLWSISVLQFLAWIPLMTIFAAQRAPLRRASTEVAAGLVGAMTVLSICASFAVTATAPNWRSIHPFVLARQMGGWILIVLFAVAAKRQTVLERQREVV